ncbi:MAG: hypothetical protein OEY94_05180 [Alphaproteobacteria bacterium]|nr:hypothetical protein [Alphaproteobacteria bacterium]
MTISKISLLKNWERKDKFTPEEIEEISSKIEKMVKKGQKIEVASAIWDMISEKKAINASTDPEEKAALKALQDSRSLSLLEGLKDQGDLDDAIMLFIAKGIGFTPEEETQDQGRNYTLGTTELSPEEVSDLIREEGYKFNPVN